MIVGTLVVIAFAIDLILRVLAYRGRTFTFTRIVAMAAEGLLLVQYVLGFGLLSDSGDKPSPIHYVLALAAILTVGAEHMATSQAGNDPKGANRIALRAVAATLALVLAAYFVGQSN